MIATTLEILATAAPALGRLAASPLPITTAYFVAKLAKLAQTEIDLFTERRNALITELGTERPATADEIARGLGGPVVQVKPEHVEAYATRIKELGAVAVTLACDPIDLSGVSLTIAAADLIALGPLIKEPA